MLQGALGQVIPSSQPSGWIKIKMPVTLAAKADLSEFSGEMLMARGRAGQGWTGLGRAELGRAGQD